MYKSCITPAVMENESPKTTKTLLLSLPVELERELDRTAKAEFRSRHSQIVKILSDWLSQQGQQEQRQQAA